ncbi:MAG: hypothetical protein ACI8X5_002212 [Planctomycetota bacterium]|jgi:hypothetical protein
MSPFASSPKALGCASLSDGTLRIWASPAINALASEAKFRRASSKRELERLANRLMSDAC